jgi:hypothetical protein
MMIPKPSPTNPTDDDLSPPVSRAEQAARGASDQQIAPHEKQAIAIETSREEDA